MADRNLFGLSPVDRAIAEARQRYSGISGMPQLDRPGQAPESEPLEGQQATTDNLHVPGASKSLAPPPEYRPIFENTARKYNVPVNVLMALGHQESRYDPNARGPMTQWGNAHGMMQYLDGTAKNLGINPYDPEQAIDAAARQIRERLDKGYSMEDAVKEHFAGPNRKLWGAKTRAYGSEVLAKARAIKSELYTQPQEAADFDSMISGRERTQGNMSVMADGPMSVPAGTDMDRVRDVARIPDALPEPQQSWEDRSWFERYVTDRLGAGWKGLQAGMASNAAGFDSRILDVIDRIDRGEQVPDMDDPLGYQQMNAEQRAQAKQQVGDAFIKSLGDTARLNKEQQAIPQHPEVQAALQSETFSEFWDHFSKAPVTFITSVGLESLPQMAPGLVMGGAAGALTRTAGGFAAGMGAGSYATDYAASVLQALGENGIDVTNQEQLQKAFQDKSLMEQVRKSAHAHASVVGAADAAAGGVAGNAIIAGKTVGRKVANAAAQMPVQGALGAGGEYGGQLAQGKRPEDIPAGEIAAEFFGEMATAPIDVAAAGLAARREQRQQAQQPDPQADAEPAQRAPLALPAPTIEVGPDGTATTASQRNAQRNTESISREAEARRRYQTGQDGRVTPYEATDGVVVSEDGQILAPGATAWSPEQQPIDTRGPLTRAMDKGVEAAQQQAAASEQAAVENGLPPVGTRVVLDPGTGEAIPAVVAEYVGNEIVFQDQTGNALQIPIPEALQVMRLPEQIDPETGEVQDGEIVSGDATVLPDVRGSGVEDTQEVGADQPQGTQAGGEVSGGRQGASEVDGTGVGENMVAATGPAEQPRTLNIEDMTLEQLQERRQYISDQARAGGGWNKTLVQERDRVDSAINRIEAGNVQAPKDVKPRPTNVTTQGGKPLVELYHAREGVKVLVRKDQWEDGRADLPTFNNEGKRQSGTLMNVPRSLLRTPEQEADIAEQADAVIDRSNVVEPDFIPESALVDDAPAEPVERDKNGRYAEVQFNGTKHIVTPYDNLFTLRDAAGLRVFDENRNPLMFKTEADAIKFASQNKDKGSFKVFGKSQTEKAKSKNPKDAIAEQFKQETGVDIAKAGPILAGIEMRNNMRKNGTPAGSTPTLELEAEPFTPEQMRLLDQWEAMRNPSSKFLFHTTTPDRIQSIAENGLKPGAKQRFEGVSASGRLSFGANEATAAYYGGQDDVMLRVSKKHKFSDLDVDMLAGEGSYTSSDTIPPEAIEAKVGGKWVPLNDAVGKLTAKKPEAKPKTASKEDLDRLFGVDQKRAKALERIANGRAWFGDQKKARDFITKNGLKDTHEAVQTGAKRWEAKEKADQPKPVSNPAIDELRNQVTGAIERGEKEPVTEQKAQEDMRPSAKSEVVIVDDALLSIAQEETKAMSGLILSDVMNDQQGVIPGKPTNINRALKNGSYTLEDLAAPWQKTRDYLRSKYGNTVTLYRADAPQSERNADTQVVYMGDKALARKFERDDRPVQAFEVPVDDVLGLSAQPNGYYEFIVKRQSDAAPTPAQSGEQTAPAETQNLASQLAGMSNAELSALIDDIAAEDTQVVDTAKPVAKRKRRTSPKTGTAKPRDQVSQAEAADTADNADVQRTAQEIAQSLGYNVSSAGMQAIEGLTKLFGGSGKLNSGLTFDEETYAQAKPHFQAMLSDAQAAGKDVADFIRLVLQKFGTGVKPYIIRFANDLRDGPVTGEQDAGNAIYEDGAGPLEEVEAGDVQGTEGQRNAERGSAAGQQGSGQAGSATDGVGVSETRGRGSRATRNDTEGGAAGQRQEPGTQDEVSNEAQPENLIELFYQRLVAGTLPKDNNGLRKLVVEYDGTEVDNERLKVAQEDLEAAIARYARDVVSQGGSVKETFDRLLEVYSSQPNLNIRTSTSVENQAYSTPAPLAYLSAVLAGIDQNTRVYEPTAGNGMLLMTASPQNATANELEDTRYNNLVSLGFDAIQGDALEAVDSGVVVEKSQDAVITNPPFGSLKDDAGKVTKVSFDGYKIGKIDHLIVAEALRTLKDDGKATLIIGADKAAGRVATDDRIFFNWLYGNYNVTGQFEVDGKLYTRQGAGWPVRVITINGRRKSGNVSPASGQTVRANTWDEVYENFESLLVAQDSRSEPDGIVDSASDQQTTNDATTTPRVDGAKGGNATGRGRAGTRTGRSGNVGGTNAGNAGNRSGRAGDELAGGNRPERPNAEQAGDDRLAQGATSQGNSATSGEGRNGRPDNREPAGNALADAENAFQSRYVPRSSRKDEGVLVPINMAQPLQDALSKIEDVVGDIDQFVANELGYDNVNELHDALMGLQVDSVAAAIYQIKNRQKGTIIADQTGIGKGRQAAAMIRWAKRNGYVPIFVTVKPQLFTDMYGDLADIGTSDVDPFILNSKEWISSPTGGKLFTNNQAQHKSVLRKIAETGELPKGRNAVFMTYSQINTENVQRQAISALSGKAIFILDESHNAGGESGTGIFVRETLEAAPGVVYLSATYAKRPDNMPVYFKTDIGEAISDDDGLKTAMASGGLSLQTVVSNNLVKAGQMFRRERSYDGVSIETVIDSGKREEHESLSDNVTDALRAIVDADTEFHEGYMARLQQELAKSGEAAMNIGGNKASESVNHTEFSAIVHNFVRQMLLGLKADAAAQQAIDSIKRGEKPLIALENTMGSFLNEYAANEGLRPGSSLGNFGYRNVLTRALDRTRYFTRQLSNGDKVKEYVPLDQLDFQAREAYRAAQEIIDSLDLNIPVSPIDWIRHRIEAAGYTVAEITGRDLAVDYSGKTPKLSQVPVSERTDKVGTTRQFNDGRLDAIILNVSGSTGISLHASEKFKDQRKRHMIVAQAAQDINIFMQMLGRVHRTGQVELPKYTILNVDLPAEKRPTALLNKKMKSLNANTSSNTESATSIKSSDMLNKYGDQIIGNYLKDVPELANSLGIENFMSEDGRPEEDLARKVTGRMALMPVQVQKDFYADVEEQYEGFINYLNETNQNDLEPRTIDFDAELVKEQVLVDATNNESPFGEEAVYGEYRVKAQGKAMTPDGVRAEAQKNLDGKTGQEHAEELVKRLQEAYDAQPKKEGDVPSTAGRDFILAHPIGSMWRLEINGDAYTGYVVNIRNTHKKAGNPFSMSKTQVTLAVNGPLRTVTIPASQWGKVELGRISSRDLEGPFSGAVETTQTAKIVTGNLLAAYGEIKDAKGSIISFTKKDGTIEQGILLPKKFDVSKNTRGDFQFRSADDVLKFLTQSNDPNLDRFGILSRDSSIKLRPQGLDRVAISTPKSKARGGKWFLDKRLLEITGDFVSTAGEMRKTVDMAKARQAIEYIMKKAPLYALPSMADEARSILGLPQKGESRPADEGTRFSVAPQTETAAFKRWFGDSKVVDADGNPLVVYHGTGADITEFDPTRTALADGVFVTPDANYASVFAEDSARFGRDGSPNVMPMYVRIEKPAYIEANEFTQDVFQATATRGDIDGIIVRNDDGSIHSAFVFESSQLKSATGNIGTFDPANPDITMSVGDAQADAQPAMAALQSGPVGSVITRLVDNGNIVIHTDASTLPAAAKDKKVQGYTDKDGRVHLVAPNLNQRNALAVALHEAFHGFGEKLIGTKRWNEMLRRMDGYLQAARKRQSEGRGTSGDFHDQVLSRLDSAIAQNAVSKGREAEEFAAYTIELYEQAPQGIKKWIDTFVGMVKDWLARRFNLQVGEITPAQLRAFAVAALKYAQGTVPQVNASVGGSAIGSWALSTQSLGVDSPAFKRWFGDSKVVDAEGKPLVVYHGTRADFTAFSAPVTAWTGPGINDVSEIHRIYFTDNKNVARSYGRRVFGSYLSIKNPLVLDANGQSWGDFGPASYISRAVSSGHDGIIVNNLRDDATGRGAPATTYIVFDPTQVKSATDNIGTFDPENPDIRYSVSDNEPRLTHRDIIERLSDGLDNMKPSVLAAIPLNYFEELARPAMKGAVNAYMKLKRSMDAYRGERHAEADVTAQKWLKLRAFNREEAKALAALMHDSTLRQVDPSIDKSDPDLSKRYSNLSAEAKTLYKEVRDAYRKQSDELDSILVDNIKNAMDLAVAQAERRYNERMQQIKDEGLKGEEREAAEAAAEKAFKAASTKARWSRNARVTALRKSFESNRLAGPYFPLARFGNYFVTVRDVDGSVISFSRKETVGQMRRLAKDMAAAYPSATIETGMLSNKSEVEGAIDPRFVVEIEEILGDAAVDDEVRDQIWQRYLESMPDMSARKRFIHRKGTEGYENDALRAFSNHMFHAAHQMARLKFGPQMLEQVNKVEDSARASDDPVRGMQLSNEMRRRHKWVMNPTGSRWAQFMTSLGFVWYLGLTPAAAIVNLSQTVLLGVPIIGARYGVARANTQLIRAFKDFAIGKGSVTGANLTADERAAMQEAYNSGLIDKSQAHDLAGVGDTGVQYSAVRQKAMGFVSWFFHQAEKLNREVTALAAYRAARDAGKTHQQAVDEAHELTWKTHFDYSNSNRPRIMQNDFAKVALVFRNFQINMLYLLFRDIHQSIKGESPQLKKEARMQLVGIMGMMALNAGVKGLPFYSLAMILMGLAFDDDDEPFTFEERMRGWTIDIFGPELGGVLLNGVPGYYLGIDLTNRVGMPDLWFRSPNRDLQGADEYQYWLSQALGAVPAIGESIWRGTQIAMEGKVARGIETAAPKVVKDVLKAWRFAQEGATTLKGEAYLAPDEIRTWDKIAQAIGFTPAALVETYERNNALKNAEQRILNQRRQLLNEFALTRKLGDDEANTKVRQRIKEFNQSFPRVRITGDTLMKSLRTRRNTSQRTQDGILLDKRLDRELRREMPGYLYRGESR